MISEGLKLMVAGMFVVYAFLSVLLVMIKISARFFGDPGRGSGSSAAPAVPGPAAGSGGGRVAAVISAAVAAYNSRKRQGF